MKKVIFLIIVCIPMMLTAQAEYIDLETISLQTNTDLYQLEKDGNETILVLKKNQYNAEIDSFTGKPVDDATGSKIALIGKPLQNYSMTADFKFLDFNMDFAGGGWFGFAVRAQDMDNFEIVWFMPGSGDSTNTIAYLPVAHKVEPWWAEGYATQKKGDYKLPKDEWFTARLDVINDEFTLYVNNEFIFTKKLSYYLTSGTPGLFVGTATDAAFRRIRIQALDD